MSQEEIDYPGLTVESEFEQYAPLSEGSRGQSRFGESAHVHRIVEAGRQNAGQ
jgi:hypothetical protein